MALSRLLPPAAVLLLGGCLSWLPAPTPMGQVDDLLITRKKAKCLLVLLPGAGDRAPAFHDEHFIEQLRKANLSIDIISADASPGYYANGVMPLRLETDIVAPARRKNYEQVWLMGISMGGFGTFHYAAQYPEHIDGIVALSPWLGKDKTVAEIYAAGGLLMWKPPEVTSTIDEDTFTPQTWGWVARVLAGDATGPQIYLGYGDTDTRVGNPKFLADALPEDHVLHAAGDHDWPTWHDLLRRFLEQSDFTTRCAL